MKVQVEIELSDKEVRMLQDNSIERVHQTAVRIAKIHQRTYKGEDGWTVEHDLRDLGPLANKIWDATRNAVYMANTPDSRDPANWEENDPAVWGEFCPRCENYVDPDTHSWCGGLE